jgi:hypothetical protein
MAASTSSVRSAIVLRSVPRGSVSAACSASVSATVMVGRNESSWGT